MWEGGFPLLSSAAATATVYSVPTTISEWIHSACKLPRKLYVESAINLARVLTEHICHTIAAFPEVQLQDHISSGKIILLLERTSVTLDGDAVDDVASITDVKFQFEMDGITPTSRENRTQSCCERSICAALGNLLLEIFSMGRSRSLQISSMNTSHIEVKSVVDTLDQCISEYGKNNFVPPEKKLRLQATPSVAAKHLTQELGMPLSICQLIVDLIDANNDSFTNSAMESLDLSDALNDICGADNDSCPNVRLTSVEETLWDLTQMETQPQLFLFDRTCPRTALSDTCLFGGTDKHLIGRGREMRVFINAKKNVSAHVRAEDRTSAHDSVSVSRQGSSFLCETVILSGYAGSGKTSILNTLINSCNQDNWFVLGCKFDKQANEHMILAKAFDNFFEKWHACNKDDDVDQMMHDSFRQVCRAIFSAVDNEGFDQLCRLVPNLVKAFPFLGAKTNSQQHDGITSMDKVGSAKKRLLSLFNVLFKSICSVGRPVLFTFDDLQWSQTFVMEALTDFIANHAHETTSETSGNSSKNKQQGLLIAGTYRSNEVHNEDDLIRSIKFLSESGNVNVTTLNVEELAEADVTRLVSAKLCLPWRYTRQLGGLVQRKTRGNPFFIAQFLRTLIQNRMLHFSVKSRRWEWDCDVVDMQMISDGVAKLLTTTFSHLPAKVIQAVKIVSCLGSQLEESAVDALNYFLPFDIHAQLQLAVGEGIIEKAGPVYQFTHDIVQQTIYELIPTHERKILHKKIGNNLLVSAGNNNLLHLLATDQINIFCKGRGCNSSDVERLQFIESNVKAAKFAMASSSFIQAQSYIDAGLYLLDGQHWKSRYDLSLDLFEMSASVSCINGDVSKMSTSLDEILSHCRTFDDSLKASSLLIKLLSSMSKFEEARSNCLRILSNLGEEFPSQINLPAALREMSQMQIMLKNITKDQIQSLPPMINKDKIAAMNFLNMFCMCSIISKPLMLPLLSSRMMKLTFEYGLCADSIVGLATAGYCIFLYTEEIQLASNIGKVSEALVEESLRKHVLRSRLCIELFTSLKTIKEPWHSVNSMLPDLENSAILSGDKENAMICRWTYCSSGLWLGTMNLFSVCEYMAVFVKEVAKHKQNTMLYSAMCLVHSCYQLSGVTIDIAGINVKSYDELDEIAEKTNNPFLVWQIFNHRMVEHFWMRDYVTVAELSDNYSAKHPFSSSPEKRILQVLRPFYEGIAYLNIARDTRQHKWRVMGEKALFKISQFETVMSKWNFENKALLLQAELQYLEGDITSADASYRASIKSAHDHKFVQEEALALELYGIFLLENKMVSKGLEQLQIAVDTYIKWGAVKKADAVKDFIGLVTKSQNQMSTFRNEAQAS